MQTWKGAKVMKRVSGDGEVVDRWKRGRGDKGKGDKVQRCKSRRGRCANVQRWGSGCQVSGVGVGPIRVSGDGSSGIGVGMGERGKRQCKCAKVER